MRAPPEPAGISFGPCAGSMVLDECFFPHNTNNFLSTDAQHKPSDLCTKLHLYSFYATCNDGNS